MLGRTGLLSATVAMNSVLLEMAVFADAPVDLTITSKAKIKNSSAPQSTTSSATSASYAVQLFPPVEFSTFCMTP
jgi:hypothetical protein